MTKFYLGVDGGGSKTAFILTDETGAVLASALTGGSSLPHIGDEKFIQVLSDGVARCVSEAGVKVEDVARFAFGSPCFGESIDYDRRILKAIGVITRGGKACVVNDVVVAHAGSLALGYGIHIVAGTGAIIYGTNEQGESARANGWSEQFSDEGSGYWLGLRTLSAFTKQSDHRYKRGPLYGLIRERLGLTEDIQIVDVFERDYAGRRDRIAKLQEILHEAAVCGDESAIGLYNDAAYELYLSARGAYDALGFNKNDGARCSYSGGLFRAGALILKPLTDNLLKINASLTEPALGPACGAALLAVKQDGVKDLSAFTENLKKWRAV